MHSHSLISHLFNSAKCQEVVQTVVVPASQSSQSILGGGAGLGPLMGWCLKASCLWPEDLPALKNGLIFSKLSTYKVMREFLGSSFKDWSRKKERNLQICVFFLDLGLFPPECSLTSCPSVHSAIRELTCEQSALLPVLLFASTLGFFS